MSWFKVCWNRTVFLTAPLVSFNVGAECAREIFLEKCCRARALFCGAFAVLGDFSRGHKSSDVYSPATAFAIAVVYSRHLQNTIYPLIVILYAMPKSAFAPLMVIWVGYGLFSKIAIAFLVAFFPIVVNTVVGLKEIEPELLELARINRASEFDVFQKIRLPNSIPYLFAGIKVAIVLSVTGAIVAEFVAANEGLGYLVLQANYNLDTAFALVILLILAVLSLGLFWLAEIIQRKMAPWSAGVREVEGSF
jgi:NitT/TauT family transport system permease protein